MGNKSRRQTKTKAPSVTAPPRSPNWIWRGNGRAYTFINLDRIATASAYQDSGGHVSLYLGLTDIGKTPNPEAHRIFQDSFAIDAIAHLLMVGIDVTGAGEVLASRFGANVVENLQTLNVLEVEHLEAFHRGEISTVAEDLRGDAGGSCVICKCTESTPCEGNDENPCHWIRPGVLCSTCAEALEVIEGLERGLLGEELLTPAERRVLELLEAAGYDPGVAANLRREFDLVDQVHDLDRSIRRAVVRKEAAAYELELGDKSAEIGGSSADRSRCPHGAAVADECKLFPRCHVCVRPKATAAAVELAGGELSSPLTVAGGGELSSPEGGPKRESTNCLECSKMDKISCTWSNGGPSPCPGFEGLAGLREDADRMFIRRTEGDINIEDRKASGDELRHALQACTVYKGLEATRSLPVQPDQPFKCRIGEEMGSAWCKVCPWYSEEGL